MQERLREGREARQRMLRFNTALRLSGIALWVRDFTQGTIEWSDSIDELLGCDGGKFPRTVAGWLATIHPDDQAQVKTAGEACRARGAPYEEKYRLRKPGGEFLWVCDTGSAAIGDEPMGVMHGALRAIPAPAMAAEKTRPPDARWQQAQKSEAIGALAVGIAHDFNNLLTGIIGNAELVLTDMKASGDGLVYRAPVETILRTGYRASAMVHQILDFSRHTETNCEPLALGSIVREVMELMRSTLPADIETLASISPGLPTIIGNAGQMHQVLVNLCTNSIHAMKGTKGRLAVALDAMNAEGDFLQTHPGIRPGPQIHLSVSDTGTGMDAGTVQHIFEPFFTTKGAGEGTGLGLAIVRGIVNEHGGRIYCQSQVGEGTVFHLYFPSSCGTVDGRGGAETVTVDDARNPRILLVEDETDPPHTTATMLSRLGYLVHTAVDGDSAEDEFLADPDGFDLLLTDLAMKDRSGLELAQCLLKVRPHFPILLMTALAVSLTDESLRKFGIGGLVMKPFTMELLGHAVRRVVGEQARVEREQPG